MRFLLSATLLWLAALPVLADPAPASRAIGVRS
jgi:hypothetical protein